MLDRRTWRWFVVRLFNLPPEGAFWRAMRRKANTTSGQASTSKAAVDALLHE